MMIAITVLAVQDNISQYLTENYNAITVAMIHYLFFVRFTLAYSSCQKGSDQRQSITITGSRLAACGTDMRCDLELQHRWAD